MNKQEEDRRVERFPRNALIYEENPVDDKNETDRLCQMLQTFTWYMYTRFNKKKTPPPFKCQGPCNSTPREHRIDIFVVSKQ